MLILVGLANYPRCARRGAEADHADTLRLPEDQRQQPGYLLQPVPSHDAIDVFDRSLYWSYAEQLTCAWSLRPASRD